MTLYISRYIRKNHLASALCLFFKQVFARDEAADKKTWRFFASGTATGADASAANGAENGMSELIPLTKVKVLTLMSEFPRIFQVIEKTNRVEKRK